MSGAARHVVVAMAAVLMMSVPARGWAAGPSDQELRLDLFRVISLEGLGCGGVKGFEQHNESDYLVRCENGQDYLVDVTEQKKIRVLDPKTSKDAADWSTPLHHVRNLLFSVLTLGGHDCGEVKDVARRGTADHSVTCRNGRRFRVDATDGGKLRVTPQ